MNEKKERIKVVIFFRNVSGEYYIDIAAIFTGDELPKTASNHKPSMIIDETVNWRFFELTKKEMNNPTTKDNEILAVIQYVEDCR